jgi:hypothetical protein
VHWHSENALCQREEKAAYALQRLDALVDLFGNWSLGEVLYFTDGSGELRTKHLSLVRNPKAYDSAASNGSSCVNVFILVCIANLVSCFLLLLL